MGTKFEKAKYTGFGPNLKTTYLPIVKIDYLDMIVSYFQTIGLVHPNPIEANRRLIVDGLPLPLPLSEMLISMDDVQRFIQSLLIMIGKTKYYFQLEDCQVQ